MTWNGLFKTWSYLTSKLYIQPPALQIYCKNFLLFDPTLRILFWHFSKSWQSENHSVGCKKLGMLSRPKYLLPAHRLALYRTQMQAHMKYCSHLWAEAPQYQVCPLDRIQRRIVRIVDDLTFSDDIDSLTLCRDADSLCIAFIVGIVEINVRIV